MKINKIYLCAALLMSFSGAVKAMEEKPEMTNEEACQTLDIDLQGKPLAGNLEQSVVKKAYFERAKAWYELNKNSLDNLSDESVIILNDLNQALSKLYYEQDELEILTNSMVCFFDTKSYDYTNEPGNVLHFQLFVREMNNIVQKAFREKG